VAPVAAGAVAAVLVSGGSPSDPRTPPGLPGLPPPFLGVAVVGSGESTAAVDAYGSVVDLREAPAGRALMAVTAERQAAGTVAADDAIVPRVRLPSGGAVPLWRADSVRQSYLSGTNVLFTTARFGGIRAAIAFVAAPGGLACLTSSNRIALHVPPEARERVHCDDAVARRAFRAAARQDRHWARRARELGAGAPAWARQMQRRSLLVLRALTDRETGAVAAGARDGWAYVWPRDAGAAILALDVAGYRAEARQAARFLLGLDLGAAARFDGGGAPIEGRAAQGDAAGWVAVAARTTGLPAPSESYAWQDLADYQEKSPGDYLGNALAATATADGPEPSIWGTKSAHRPWVLGREPSEPGSEVDSAAAWAVQPFSQPALFPAARTSMQRLLDMGGRFGIVPSEDWPEADPWTAPTAWSAWAFAALARDAQQRGDAEQAGHDRRGALRLLAALRRAATPAGDLPERVDARTGVPRSTTPLAWPHAFAIVALYELWPPGG